MAEYRSEYLRGRLFLDRQFYNHDTVKSWEKQPLPTGESIYLDVLIASELSFDVRQSQPDYQDLRISFRAICKAKTEKDLWSPITVDELAKHLSELGDELLQAALVRMDELKEV